MFSKEKKEKEELANKKNQIEKGTKVIGDIHTEGNLRLDGELEGNMISKSKVVLGATCRVSGNVKAQNAEIEGHVSGVVEIAEMLLLKPTAVIEGDILTGKLVVEPGAVFNGQCKMGAVVKGLNDDERKEQRKGHQHEQGQREKSA